MRKEKEDEIKKKMQSLHIDENDLLEKFILGSGRGGQNLHKTSSCVYLKHIPTGIEVKCQKERSRDLNRWIARRMLCEKYEEKILLLQSEKQKQVEKIRRQKRTKSRKQKQKMIEEKRLRSEKKGLRAPCKEHLS
ncbi:MAG: peptide chain release factor-like protein [Chlamydiae bacterium]|nr:peptide chain release factor-like protein [Chlamydiota bacterium]